MSAWAAWPRPISTARTTGATSMTSGRRSMNPKVSRCSTDRASGFGLLQRDRSYETFQDDDQHFERRPSLWIEPLGEWGQGSVQLLEIPSDAEINDNILTYWRPRAPMAAGSDVSFAYRQYWG